MKWKGRLAGCLFRNWPTMHPKAAWATSNLSRRQFWLEGVPGNYPLGAWGEGGEVNAFVNHTLVAFWSKDKVLGELKGMPEAFW